MNALIFERPIWFATGPLVLEDEAEDREEFIYHRPVLVNEVAELLAPRSDCPGLEDDVTRSVGPSFSRLIAGIKRGCIRL